MAKKTDHGESRDNLPKLLRLLSSAWTMNILFHLHTDGPTRFGELKKRLGSISTKTLTERLRELEGDGLVLRHYEPTVPPQVTYSLTKKTGELGPAIRELELIAKRWYDGKIS
jgi:DNA-binding HxlR family transcriptional regulator